MLSPADCLHWSAKTWAPTNKSAWAVPLFSAGRVQRSSNKTWTRKQIKTSRFLKIKILFIFFFPYQGLRGWVGRRCRNSIRPPWASASTSAGRLFQLWRNKWFRIRMERLKIRLLMFDWADWEGSIWSGFQSKMDRSHVRRNRPTSWTLSIDRVLLFCGALDGPTAMDTRDEDSILLDFEPALVYRSRIGPSSTTHSWPI